MQILIDHGAVVDVCAEGGLTPLHIAARSNCPHSLLALVNNGAALDALDELGRTALQLAVMEGHWECVSILERRI